VSGREHERCKTREAWGKLKKTGGGERMIRIRKVLAVALALALFAAAAGVVSAAGKQYTIGINNYSDSDEFCYKVHQNIEKWAKQKGFKVVYAEASMEPEKVKANLDTFALQGVDAIFEFNWLTDVTAKWMKDNPGIVMVTGDYVVPGAYYFGANQYEAGVVLGRFLAGEVKKRWNGKLDAMIFAACYQCGELLIKRMDGIRDGFKETYKNFPENMIFRFENNNPTTQQTQNTKQIVTDFYTAHPDMTNIVVATNNENGGLGALAAVETMGKQKNFFILSHGGDTPFQEKVREGKGDVWIGSVAYMPERYGEFMIPWLLDILEKKPNVPKEMSPKHFVLTKDNLDKYYPKK
jgi:ribose transport system substrate-binding protein